MHALVPSSRTWRVGGHVQAALLSDPPAMTAHLLRLVDVAARQAASQGLVLDQANLQQHLTPFRVAGLAALICSPAEATFYELTLHLRILPNAHPN